MSARVRLLKWQGPIAPPRYQEPAQIVQDVPPLDMRMLFASGTADAIKPDYADRRFAPYAEECDADRLGVSP